MSLELATAVCTKCDEEKGLTEYYKNDTKRGRWTWCKDCERAASLARRRAKRERMGEEEWLAYQRANTQRSRAAGNTQDKAQRDAWAAAQRRLRDAHRKEFDQYYREERYERGLNIE